MKLSDKIYDCLKWLDLVAIPACAVAYVGLSTIWGWPYGEAISKTANIVCVLIGALIGISTAEYNKENKDG